MHNLFKKIFNKRSQKRVYLDYASAMPVEKESLKAYIDATNKYFSNPSSIHKEGDEVKEVLYRERKIASKFIKAKSGEIYFTASTTEANNIFIQGVIKNYNTKRGSSVSGYDVKPHIISSRAEHSAILAIIENLENEGLAEVSYITPKENGVINIDEVKNEFRENTVLVTLSYVNSETGSKQNIKEISKIIKVAQLKRDEKMKQSMFNENYQKIYLYTDASQAALYENIDVNNLGVDGLSFGSHKIGGPAGGALLYVKRNTKITGVYYGGGQEGGFRPGSENVPTILGFVKAMTLIKFKSQKIKESELNHISEIKNYLIKNLGSKIKVIGDVKPRHIKIGKTNIYEFDHSLPHITLLHMPDVLGEEALLRLDAAGISVSTASACSLIESSGSNFLKSQGKIKESKETIRVSTSSKTSKADIDRLISELHNIVDKYSSNSR